MVVSKTTNPQEQARFLNLRTFPARLNSTETSLILGFPEAAIATLVEAKLLKPLGKPARNAPKYFSAEEVMELRHDRDALGRMSDALARHWRSKNARKSGGDAGEKGSQ